MFPSASTVEFYRREGATFYTSCALHQTNDDFAVCTALRKDHRALIQRAFADDLFGIVRQTSQTGAKSETSNLQDQFGILPSANQVSALPWSFDTFQSQKLLLRQGLEKYEDSPARLV